MRDLLGNAFDAALFAISPIYGTLWQFVGDKIEDALGIDTLIDKFFFFFEYILPMIQQYALSLLFDKSVEICDTTGRMVVGYIESNFPNMGDLYILYFLFGFIIFIFIIKLVIHIVSGLLNIL